MKISDTPFLPPSPLPPSRPFPILPKSESQVSKTQPPLPTHQKGEQGGAAGAGVPTMFAYLKNEMVS